MKKDVDLKKLSECLDRDYQAMEPYRENLYEIVRESCGSHYSDPPRDNSPDNPERPVNLLALYERILMGHLVGGDPRFLASTFDRAMRPYVGTLEDWGNRQLVKLGFGDLLKRAVKYALASMAILKVAITSPSEDRFNGYGGKAGEVGMWLIDLEDWVWDMRAKHPKECWYMGHRYVAMYDHVKNSKTFSSKARKKVVPKEDTINNPGGGERINRIGRGDIIHTESYMDYVELWEIWIRDKNLIVTFDADGDFEEPLLVQEWVGPPCGPYHFLQFGDVIGNLMPKSPEMDLLDMHRSYNRHWMKCDNQALEAKRVCVYQSAEDAAKVEKTDDGGYVKLQNPDKFGEKVAHSGPDQQTVIWTGQTRDYFSRHAGNMDALGGLGSQADTLGQEKLVNESASRLVQSMGMATNKFAEQAIRAMGWFWWHSPYEEMKSSYSPTGAPEASITRKVTPMDRFGKAFEDLDIQFDPYSLTSQTPQTRLMTIDRMLKEVFLPALPLFGQEGVSDLLDAFVRKVAKYTNNPDLIELLEKLVGVQGPAEQQATNPTEPGAPTNQQETIHTRVNQSGMSDKGHEQVLQQLLAGGSGGQGAGGLGQMTRAG